MIPLEPRRFRSPLLEALPRAPKGRRRTLRRFVAGMLVVAVAVTVLAVARRWLDPEGPGRFLYRLHDGLYLPLKGYLLTWLYPWSWIYLLSLATLLLFALSAFVWARPLLAGLHTAVVGRMVRSRRARRRLSSWSRFLHRRQAGLRALARRFERWPVLRRGAAWALEQVDGPLLLDEVIEDERLASLRRLDRLDPGDPAALEELAPAVELAVLAASVSTPQGSPGKEPYEALLILDQVLLRLELVCAAVGKGVDAAAERLRSRLEEELRADLRRAIKARASETKRPVRQLAQELFRLLGEDDPATRRTIADGVEKRRQRLDQGRRLLERWAVYAPRGGANLEELAVLDVPRSALEARLATDLALLAALRYGFSSGAAAFLESLEGWRFALFLMAPEKDVSESAPEREMEGFRAALERLPQPFDYRVCAQLLEGEFRGDANLEAARRRRSEVIKEEDLRLVLARQEDLLNAAADMSSTSASSSGDVPQ